MRNFVGALLLILGLGLGGCGYFFPGFEGPLGLHSYIHNIPVGRITTQLECELRDFIENSKYGAVLDQTQTAGLTIVFQTDQSGTFQYIGIDLKKFGLGGIANLIAASNKTPSLQAKIQGKTTASSQLDLTIPQRKSTLDKVNCDPSRRLLASLSVSSWLDRFFRNLYAEYQVNDGEMFVLPAGS